MKLLRTAVALATASLLLVGCEANKPSSASDNAVPASTAAAVPLFEPLAQDSTKIPFPVDLLFSGSTDGTLNIPGVANSVSGVTAPAPEASPTIAALADPMVALNTSSGFSTTAMLTIPFSAPILNDQANLMAGIRIFQTNGSFPLGTMLSVVSELAYGVDFVASVSGNTVAVVPLRPLASATSYIVVVTTSLKSADGNPVAADGQYADARAGQLAPLPTLTTKVNAQEGLAASYAASNPFPPTILQGSPTPVPLTPGAGGNIALSYTVTTQNTTAALQQAQGVVAAAASGATPPQIQVAQVADESGMAVYAGKLANMVSFLSPADPVHSIWNNNGYNLAPNPADPTASYRPSAMGTVDVPILITAPDAATQAALSCPANMPVVIYQHGITSNRGSLLALGGALTKGCMVGVAIDLPEHGIMQGETLGSVPIGVLAQQADAAFGVQERLVVGGALGAAPVGCMSADEAGTSADGRTVCSSGDSYINLVNLANSRDVLRQSVVDLNSLYLALTGGGVVTVDSSTSPPTMGALNIDATKVSFVGMSLGSIVGETFVATLGNISGSLTSAVFNVGGGGIAKLLDGSPSFEPVITAGLAAQGVTKPSSTYESFLIAAQTLVDSADPINYADTLNALKSTTPILFQEVVGNGGTNAPDLVVPNNVFGNSPFAAAWHGVSGSPQTGWLTGQNTVTNPAVLGGTDSLVQGTSFLSLAQGMASPAVAGCVAAYGPLCPAISVATGGVISPFVGMGLPQVNSNGQITVDVGGTPTPAAAPFGVVRFNGGAHGSLLNPDVDGDNNTNDFNGLVTTMMQTQVANFIGTAVAGSATIVGEAACTPVLTVPCTGTIANW